MPTCLLRSTRTFRKFLCAVKRLPRTSRPSGLGRDSCLRNPLSQYRCHERQSRSAHFSVEPVPLLAPHRSRTLFCLQNTVPGIIHEKCGLEAAKVRRVRLHDLRHTYASLMLQQGESITYVKDQMGHHSIQITVDLYGHLIPGANRAAANRLESSLLENTKTATAGAVG